MDHALPLITTIAVALSLALLMGFIAIRIGLPALVGYLVAGVIIGPFTPGFVANTQIAQELAEIGVILLMFGVGLHFSLANLLEVRNISLPGAVVQIMVATGLGVAIAMTWGWKFGGALVFGLALSVASTVVLLRALEERNILKSINGRIAMGWLIVEDLFMIIVLVLLPPLSGWLGGHDSHQGESLPWILMVTFIKISTFIALMLLVGRRFFPKLLRHVAQTGSRELFTLCVVAAAVGIAYAAATLFGVSFALGAFFAGMIMRESKFSHRAAEESLPLREAFAVLFFVAVGMLFDPMVIFEHPLQVFIVTSIIIVGKSIAAFVLVLAFGYSFGSACIVSASLAQIGEFSFILAELGVRLGLLPLEGQSFLLAGAIISIAINPLVFKLLEYLQDWVKSKSNITRLLAKPSDPLAKLPISIDKEYIAGQVILIGYGRVGKKIAKSLLDHEIPFVVIDEIRELVQRLRARGINAMCGDASNPVVLSQSHVTNASVLVIAVSDRFNIRPIVKCARLLNKTLDIAIRAHDEYEAVLLEKEGPGKAFFAENEIAKNMSAYILNRFRKSHDRI
ncbi:MAG: Kef family K(+) transporter [Legionella sp.]|nr:MAG: Kef family K(+) transporter [Legionella sp.]